MVSTVDLNTVAGLSEQEAIARLKDDGYNELPSSLFESHRLLEERKVVGAIVLDPKRDCIQLS